MNDADDDVSNELGSSSFTLSGLEVRKCGVHRIFMSLSAIPFWGTALNGAVRHPGSAAFLKSSKIRVAGNPTLLPLPLRGQVMPSKDSQLISKELH